MSVYMKKFRWPRFNPNHAPDLSTAQKKSSQTIINQRARTPSRNTNRISLTSWPACRKNKKKTSRRESPKKWGWSWLIGWLMFMIPSNSRSKLSIWLWAIWVTMPHSSKFQRKSTSWLGLPLCGSLANMKKSIHPEQRIMLEWPQILIL